MDILCSLNVYMLLRESADMKYDSLAWIIIQSPVSKHEYLGEYTGELISHREADKRGKIYDRENSSFLFNLNDQVSLTTPCRFTMSIRLSNQGLQLLKNCLVIRMFVLQLTSAYILFLVCSMFWMHVERETNSNLPTILHNPTVMPRYFLNYVIPF